MATPDPPGNVRDDRVSALTRWVSLVIIPFLVVAFVVLVPWPSDTARLFAWDIKPTLTPMVLGSVYLGGAYFFLRAFRATEWHTVKGGFVPVGTFATLMGVATIAHWDKFLHTHVAFWLWAGLYFTTPFLVFWVFLANRKHDAPATGADLLLSVGVSRIIAVVGGLSLLTGMFLFLLPSRAVTIWPWTLTPLTVAGTWRHLLPGDRRPGCPVRPPVEQRPGAASGGRPDARADRGGWRAGNRGVRLG